MLLAVDAGNTNVVFALVEDGAIRARWRIATDPRRTADQYAVWLHQLIELEGLPRDVVDAVIIGTVVPRALHNLEVLANKYFRVEPLVAGFPFDEAASSLVASAADFRLELMDSSHDPTRVKICDGMWFACADAGAILAYMRAAPKPFFASTGLS